MVVEYFAIGIALLALGFSIWSWKKPRPIEQKQHDASSMENLSRLLNTHDFRDHKKNAAFWYWRRKDTKKTVNFENSPFEKSGHALKQGFNEASALYERNLIDNEHFRDIYGGTVVRFWKILEEDIKATQQNNSEICKHFESVAKELMGEYGIKGEPYRTKPQLPVPGSKIS